VLLDQIMTARVERYQGRDYRILGARHGGDRSTIRGGATAGEPHAQLISAQWIRLPGEAYRRRSVVARVAGEPINGGPVTPLLLTYSRQAYEFDPLMNRVGWALVIATLIGGVIAALWARFIARTSLRPLRATADVIGTIDDRSLDRRIDAARLPPELVPMAEKLNAMLERLERAQQQRRRFLADASHELRTPVAALMTALELSMRRTRDAAAYRATIESCLADARHLRQLVEALMAQVKSEAIGETHEWESIDLAKFVQDCVAIVRPLAENRAVTITCNVQPSLPVVTTQPTRLRSVLINLVSNAVEYNHEGGRIDVIVARAVDNGAIELSIADTGVGIPTDQLPNIFEPFFRGDESRAPSEHLGLGLYLVKSHVEALGGRVSVESNPGAGTRFLVRLPASSRAGGQPEDSILMKRS
jgi:signal transduction histidine kinase